MPSDTAKKFAYLIKNYPEIMLPPPLTPEEIHKRRQIGARSGHIKRRLMRNEPLTGHLLEIAIRVAGETSEIASKLKTGQQLNEYELSLMVDIYLSRP